MRKIFAALVCVCMAAGCGKRPVKPVAGQAAGPATTTAATIPSPVQLIVGGEPIDFADARLTVHADGGDTEFAVRADDHTGGSSTTFRFSGTIRDATPADLPGESVHRVVDPNDPNMPDSPDGLLLANGSVQIEPRDVMVTFGGTYPRLTVSISGTFVREDSDGQPIRVSGDWTLTAEER